MRNIDEQYCSLEKAILNDLAAAGDNPAAVRLAERWDKRFIPSDTESLDTKARLDFLDINDSVTPPVLLGSDAIIIGEAQAFIYDALCKFTRGHSDVPQCEFDWTLLFDLWRFGPGSSKGIIGSHFVQKIRQRMTTTAKALPFVLLLRKLTPRLNMFDLEHPKVDGTRIIEGSRLGTVGKNKETNRTIATEPLGNMALQLALGTYIQLALKAVGLDITTQEGKNKKLAYLGSLLGHICTIDLKSASDLISMELIKLLWPTSWYDAFMVTRSHKCTIVEDHTIELRMMSTMGNGFTFPMMTMTLLALLYGFLRASGYLKNKKLDYNLIGVYGDDIICPVVCYGGFTKLLERCGLRINNAKSFAVGPFRESCGGDYYLGEDITPFYIESLQTDSEVYVAMNKVLLWGSRHGYIMWRTLRYLRSLLTTYYLVPEWEDPSSGLLSISPPRRYKFLKFVNERKEKLICSDVDLLCILGGYVDSGGLCSKGHGDFMNWTPSRERGDDDEEEVPPIVHEVKKARLPKGYLDGHNPFYSDYESSVLRGKVLLLLS